MKRKRFPLGSLWTNGYLFWDDDGVAFFVDPGGDPEEVISWIKEHKISLRAVILTHGHADHIAGASRLVGEFGCDLLIHREDETMLSRGDKNLSLHLGTDCPVSQATGYLEDGMILEVGDMGLKVIHTPGHTMGSCCIIVSDRDGSVLVSGDTLFARSIGRTDLPGSAPELMVSSLELIRGIDCDMPVLPGHGPETSLDREKRENHFLS